MWVSKIHWTLFTCATVTVFTLDVAPEDPRSAEHGSDDDDKPEEAGKGHLALVTAATEEVKAV